MLLSDWLITVSLPWLGATLFAAMLAAAFLGHRIAPKSVADRDTGSGEGHIVQAMLGLLALLIGFTFSLAISRFETRRELVLQQANAVGTAYLRVQLLPEPHRARLSGIFVEYVDNVIKLAYAGPRGAPPLLARDDEILLRLWAATAAAYDRIKPVAFGNSLVESVNAVIDMDGARRAARTAHVPAEVFAVLFVYLVGAAGVLGYVLHERRGLLAAGFLLVFMTMSQLLIVDIDSPTTGRLLESQDPMEWLRETLKHQPPIVFDRWREKGE